MPRFGRRSKRNLASCHNDLQLVLKDAIKITDFSVLCGHRGKTEQNLKYESGNTKVQWPNSCHNILPSEAVDVAPYPIDWGTTGSRSHRGKALSRFYLVAGVILACASQRGITIRHGGDWDMDGDIFDQSFDDLGHFELVRK